MNRKRNVSYIKPEDPQFLKILKKQAGYDDRNHKFDKLENNVEDFVDDKDSELPQVVVLKEGDLTAQEAETEKKRLESLETQTKADLSQKVVFKSKKNSNNLVNADKQKQNSKNKLLKVKKCRQLLSFGDDEEDD